VTRALAAAALAVISGVFVSAMAASTERDVLLGRSGWTPVTRDMRFPRSVPLGPLVVVGAVPAWLVGVALGGVAMGLAAVGAVVAGPALRRRRSEARRAAALQSSSPRAWG
jgi:hypothetical protein